MILKRDTGSLLPTSGATFSSQAAGTGRIASNSSFGHHWFEVAERDLLFFAVSDQFHLCGRTDTQIAARI
jgi:hypothetical protein